MIDSIITSKLFDLERKTFLQKKHFFCFFSCKIETKSKSAKSFKITNLDLERQVLPH
jgi:hypothetical protein